MENTFSEQEDKSLIDYSYDSQRIMMEGQKRYIHWLMNSDTCFVYTPEYPKELLQVNHWRMIEDEKTRKLKQN